MKKTLFFLTTLFLTSLIMAQKREICFPLDHTKISIYLNELTDSVIYNLYQDFDTEDHLYEVFIIDKSPLRFKVEFRDIYDSSHTVKTGWVNKENCGVWDRGSYNDAQQYMIKLFKEPNKESEFIAIFNKPTHALTVIDYSGDFLQVMFESDGKIYIGWIDKYCPNIFNSCS